jgi:hypothetical protein
VKQNLGPDSVTAIIIQVKNAMKYNATLKGGLFDAMDTAAIFSEPNSDVTSAQPKQKRKKLESKEVIRIVFALASPEPTVRFRERADKQNHFDGFTAFDIWLAGLSNEKFRQIQSQDLTHYKTLLERSLAPHDALKLEDVPQIA